MATQTVRIAERIRGRLMRQIESLAGARAIPPILHGKDHQGVPLRDHTHLFILPRANNKGQIDHVLLLTKDPRGFSANPELLRAIVNTRSIRWIQDLRLMAAWTGKADDPCVRPSTRQVVSATPFLTVRHWRKGRGSVLNFLRAEIRRECRNHGLPEPVRIEPRDRIGPFSPSQFVRHRQDDPARPGHAFSLEFAEDVQTPFSLGYGCHFGLGQFEAR